MTEAKRALITGITGQDGSYLSELLLEKGYEVHGIIRRTSTFNTDRIDHIYIDPHQPDAKLFLHYGDLTDGTTLRRILEQVQPVEVYNLGAQSHVRVSFDAPEYTVDAVGVGVLRLLEAIRDYQKRTGIEVRFYQAGSSEMFGKVMEVPQKETTPFYPRSPYACAKVYGHWQTINYRESYDLFASRPSKDEDIKLIYELQEELMAKDKLLRKAEDEMEFYKMTLINSEENYNKVFGSKPKIGSLNPLEAKQSNVCFN